MKSIPPLTRDEAIVRLALTTLHVLYIANDLDNITLRLIYRSIIYDRDYRILTEEVMMAIDDVLYPNEERNTNILLKGTKYHRGEHYQYSYGYKVFEKFARRVGFKPCGVCISKTKV